jgi:GNAT superfamily N-acetyltransferase
LEKLCSSNLLAMTFPRYRALLLRLEKDPALIAMGAFLHDVPVGLVLARLEEEARQAELLSLFVNEARRGEGIGTMLLSRCEGELCRRGMGSVYMTYSIGLKSVAALEKALHKADWAQPIQKMVVGRFERERIQEMRWIQRDILPESWIISEWKALSDNDREFIRSCADKPNWYDSRLANPFSDPEILEPLNSLVLRYDEKIVGWIVTHRIDLDTIRYTHLFAKRDLQSFGVLIPLFAEALRLHQAFGPPRGIFTVRQNNASLIAFLYRYIAPHLTSLTETRETRKKLLDREKR